MKKRNFLLLFISVFSLLVYLSNSSGPGNVSGLAVTAAPGENGGYCNNAGCHTGGAIEQTTTIEIRDSMDQIITEYEPGISYQVSVIITPSTGQPNAYGFQMVSLLDSDNSDVNGWDISSSGVVHTVELLNRNYVEHSVPNIDSNKFTVKWIAPAEGSGSVSFYAAGNAVNLDGTNSGDGPDTVKVALEEAIVSSIEDVHLLSQDAVQLFPNPVSDVLTIRIMEPGSYYLRIVDIIGREHHSERLLPDQNEILVRNWDAGIYFVNIFDTESHPVWAGKLIKD